MQHSGILFRAHVEQDLLLPVQSRRDPWSILRHAENLPCHSSSGEPTLATMNALVISEDTLKEQLPECKDGEVGDFTVKGGTLTMVPGVGAVVSGDTITKAGGSYDEGMAEEPAPKMSPAAMAVVGRKGVAVAGRNGKY